MIVPLPKSQTRHPARARSSPPSLIHAFLTRQKVFTKHLPCLAVFQLRLRGRLISVRKQHVGS